MRILDMSLVAYMLLTAVFLKIVRQV